MMDNSPACCWMEAEEFVCKNYGNPADLISFDRGAYQHWAMYEGDGYVINVPAEDKNDTSAVVSREKLIDVANKVPNKTKVRVNNLLKEALLLPVRNSILPLPLSKFFSKRRCDFNRSVETQLNSARNMVGIKVPYNFVLENCEHFVTKCKYGHGFSSQTPIDNPILLALELAFDTIELGILKEPIISRWLGRRSKLLGLFDIEDPIDQDY